ncbi:hypothetical protein ABE288_07955 [Bacillus salipaludis]|uniref:hypothetical protein n=1 Tax=Bacillus salipaludis TaxID=2547811 RepID=UPI003D1BE4A6
MKKILIAWCIFGTFLIGCSNLYEQRPLPHNPLLSEDVDKYSLFIVEDEGMAENGWQEWLDKNEIKNVKKIYGENSLKDANNQYKFLKLEKSPAFVVFNSKKIVFKTYSEKELIKFLKSNNPY